MGGERGMEEEEEEEEERRSNSYLSKVCFSNRAIKRVLPRPHSMHAHTIVHTHAPCVLVSFCGMGGIDSVIVSIHAIKVTA